MKTIITFKPIQELTNSQVIIYNGFINNECIEYFGKSRKNEGKVQDKVSGKFLYLVYNKS